MNAKTCKLSSLFNSGEDFDDEDLLRTDWPVPSASGPADVAAAVSSCALRASSVAHRAPENRRLQQTGERSAVLCSGSASRGSAHDAAAAGPTVALGLTRLPSSVQPPRSHPPTRKDSHPALASQQSCANLLEPSEAQDEFDDWDVDLADLDECDGHAGQPSQPPAPAPAALAKSLRPPACGGIQTRPGPSPNEHSPAQRPLGSSHLILPLHPPPASHVPALVSRPTVLSAPLQSPGVFPGLSASSAAPSPTSRMQVRPQQLQRPWATPRASVQARSLFETVSPARPSSPSVNCSSLSPHPLHTPVLTNRLVQLVSASNKLPRKRPCSEPHRLRTRRFPGPAGLLPQQPQGHSLDEIVVSNPQTPARGVVARPPSQGSSSQADEDEFGSGAWAAMKAETGLDERNPSCFLRSYSVVMVLRKAALKQLAKNKVPNMAVLLKSIVHTHADAKAVFKDPTGEIQGTVHRRLLEDRAEELKVGAVLLLKQVGVFSPSHRNHYLNVTPNNLLRIYDPDGVRLSSTQLPPFCLEPTCSSASAAVLPEPNMQLVFDEEDDEGREEAKCTGGEDPRAPADTRLGSGRGPQEASGNPAPPNPGWDTDDDLDELLGELPEDTYSF